MLSDDLDGSRFRNVRRTHPKPCKTGESWGQGRVSGSMSDSSTAYPGRSWVSLRCIDGGLKVRVKDVAEWVLDEEWKPINGSAGYG